MRIAFIGDLHYPSMIGHNEKVTEARDAFYAKFLHTFFEINADYYVSIGDLTNFGKEDELREVYEIIRKYDKPFIHTFGNHDLYGVSRDEVLNISNNEQNISIATDPVNIISLETARDHDHEDYSGYLSNKQLQWLEAEIAKSEEKPMIIFAHHPVYNTTANSNFPYLSIQPEIPIFDVLRSKKGYGIYINGHNHKDSIETIDNWSFVQANAVLDDQSIRVLEINDNAISIQSLNVTSPELKSMAQIIGSNINHFQLNPFGMGTTPNREKFIKINQYV